MNDRAAAGATPSDSEPAPRASSAPRSTSQPARSSHTDTTTYTIGFTTAGVQTFRYRGARHVSLPGQLVILHPDEMHDGAAGTDHGLGYRALYAAPGLVHDALHGAELPFVPEPVQKPTGAARGLASLLADLDDPVSDLAQVDIAATIADALRALSGSRAQRPATIDLRAAELARDYLTAHAREHTSASMLEQVTGADRFTLARHFRRAFGTSPDRYRAMRRLDLARAAIEAGRRLLQAALEAGFADQSHMTRLLQAALEAGFADQSHMTRQFKRAYGMTPGRWMALTAS